jgi:porphobilinogen synthase
MSTRTTPHNSELHTPGSHTALNLKHRPRRLRRSEALRGLVRETRLTPERFIYPLFVTSGEGRRREVTSMPGVFQLSVDEAIKEAAAARAEGVPGVLLFGLPDDKDASGSGAYDPEAPVQQAVRALKREVPGLLVVTDVCLCEYTSHGHCGILIDDEIANDQTVEQLARAALSHAAAGADVVAPSDMMDGRVGAIREALDQAGFSQVAIMSYAAKYCSAFYGPFRDAADSAPQFGDRKSYQLDVRNRNDALASSRRCAEEGADLLMVKPGQPSADLIRPIAEQTGLPVGAYQVSGEYTSLVLLARENFLNFEAGLLESWYNLRRAGASFIITYGARLAGGMGLPR